MILYLGTSYRRITRSMGVLAFTWSLIAIVIVNAYNSSVISYLSTNYRKPEVSTFKELAENPNYNMVTVKGSAAEYDVKVSDNHKVLFLVFLGLYTRNSKYIFEYRSSVISCSQGFLKFFKRQLNNTNAAPIAALNTTPKILPTQ